MNAKSYRVAALAVTLAMTAVLATGCASPSLESAASDCGGRDAGIMVDDSALAVSVDSGTDALTCVLPKVFSEKADRYAVAMMVDDGAEASHQVDGRDVALTEMAGATVILISAK